MTAAQQQTRPHDDDASEAAEAAAARPWQFRLRTLLLAGIGLSGLLAIMLRIGMVWSAILLWAVFLASAHVVGNALGTRSTRREGGEHPSDSELPPATHRGKQLIFAPTTQLGFSRRLGWLMFVFIAAGAVAGAVCGVAAIQADGPAVAWRNVILAGVSAAGLGGLFCFIASSFVRVFYRAAREASREASSSR